MSIIEAQQELKTNKSLPLCDISTLKYVQKPIGKAIYKGRVPKEQYADPKDKINCDICGKTYTRSNKNAHIKTNHHQIYSKMNKKMAKLLLDE